MACPTNAISLVFGTERRGLDLPHIKETFETNVNGVFIAGELGGMGLIRNAVKQGSEAIEYIGKSLPNSAADYDVLIVGAGPAGLSATLQAHTAGLKYLTVEQEDTIGGTVLHYPRQKIVMTQPMEIPLYGKFKRTEITKEELIELWNDILRKTDIPINCAEKVQSLEKNNGCFAISTGKALYHAKRVLLTIGRRGTPRRLGVAGEKTTKVAYKLLDPEQYRRKHLLVVGGGDSAVEAALALSEQEGSVVSLSYRKNVFSRIKDRNLTRLEKVISDGRINLLMETSVQEIRTEEVVLTGKKGVFSIPNDFVFVFIGGELPTTFLEKIGIKMERKYGER